MAVPTLRCRPLKKNYIDSRAVNGQTLDTLGTIDMTFHLGQTSWRHTFHVLRESTQAVLLGLDFLAENRALLDLGRGVLEIGGASLPLLYQTQLIPKCCNVSLADSIVLPPLSEALVPVHVRSPGGATKPVTDFEGYLEPNVPDSAGLVVAHTVANVKNGITVARVLNPTGKAVELKPGLYLGEFYPVQESDIVATPLPSSSGKAGEASVDSSAMIGDSPISEEQKAQLLQLLSCFSDVFSPPDHNSGRCSLVKHHIRTGDHPPVKQRAYRASPEKRAEIERQVARLLAEGLVEESYSPWASPVVLVKKKGGQWRFCIDYRRLNAVTIKDSHPLPRVDDSLDALAGSLWFSTLDFSNGYWQVEVAEEDREKTAFTTGRGLYQWRAMPMGLSNSPATFQRMMELVLRGLPWHICLVYLDDILVYSRTFEDHLSHLQEVLTRIQSAGLKLNSSKCHFVRDHVVFLGHVVSRDGLHPDPRNTEKVRTWPTPTTVSEVRAFVGLCSYYRRFVQNFSQHAAPLNRLASKNVPFEWTPGYASKDAVGAVLAQDKAGVEGVVAYASQALTHAQKQWSTFDRELWAIVWAVREFKHYVGMSVFTIVTDHRPLLGLRNMTLDNDPTGRRGRWILELDPFNWSIIHKDGSRHLNADALSRRPADPTGPAPGVVNVVEPGGADCTKHANDLLPPASPTPLYSLCCDEARLRSLQRADPDISTVLEWLVKDISRPPKGQMKGSSLYLRKLWAEFDRFSVDNGLLCRTDTHPLGRQLSQVVIPSTMVPELLQHLHGGPTAAHFSVERVWEKARQSFYWPFMFRDIRRWCEQCRACQTRRSPVPKPRAPMGVVQVCRPLQRVAADILELPVTSKGNKYVLVVEDYFTKYVNLYALPNQTAYNVAHCLFEDYVLVHGVPEMLHSDQGRQFEAEVIQTLCRLLGIKKTHTTAYNPKSDGMVERHNRTLIDQLAKMLLSHGGEWDGFLKQVAFAYNSSPHASTRFSPFYLMHGREARVPADVLASPPAQEAERPGSVSEYVTVLVKRLESAFDIARLCATEATAKQKLYYDEAACHRPYRVGSLVWLNNPTESRTKLAPHWKGPYQVVQVFPTSGGPVLTYSIVNPLVPLERAQVVHHDRLKPYTLPLPSQAPVSPTVVLETSPKNDEGVHIEPAQPMQSRTGRVLRAPSHLRDYVT
ncbi:hypothetical protein WMY93_031928 [Mugilogobius chulae]|uniref:Gypsy retrotransposon integrase-like protein 1 n=1 Tax=Mugilogobius chulae TaxID=88201 RepID=A0AAW0MDE6_9GOBI